jgi:hypothetical protein
MTAWHLRAQIVTHYVVTCAMASISPAPGFDYMVFVGQRK